MKRKILIIGGILVLVLLLGGAAFIGGRLLAGQGFPATWSGLPFVQGSGNGQAVKRGLVQSDELPQTLPDVHGLFDHRQDKSIFVGAGEWRVGLDENGTVDSQSDGPTIEVVVTSQTIIYQDVTMRQYDGPPPDGQEIQQVVEAGALDEIGEGSLITVWGRKSDERIIADVLVYMPPTIFTK